MIQSIRQCSICFHPDVRRHKVQSPRSGGTAMSYLDWSTADLSRSNCCCCRFRSYCLSWTDQVICSCYVSKSLSSAKSMVRSSYFTLRLTTPRSLFHPYDHLHKCATSHQTVLSLAYLSSSRRNLIETSNLSCPTGKRQGERPNPEL